MSGKMVVKFRDSTDDIGCRVLNSLYPFRYIEDFFPYNCFYLRNDRGTIVAERL